MPSGSFPITQCEVGYSPLRTLAASREVAFRDLAADQHAAIEQALARADIGLCGYKATISVAPNLAAPFQVRPGEILLHPRAFDDLAAHLRHAIELTLWLRAGEPTRAQLLTIALLGARTTEPDRLAELLPLLGTELLPDDPIAEAAALAGRYHPIAQPTELILTQQGDERLLIDPATGLNKYGCAPRPRPEAITFSSCTASSVSEYAYREAELLRQRLMRSLFDGDLAAEYAFELEDIRSGIKGLLDLEHAGVEIILCSSGTDAELFPVFTLRPSGGRLINIVVAPDEVGSGTVHAAGGRHFSVRAPLGATVHPGDPVAGIGAESVEVIGVPIRAADGACASPADVAEQVRAIVAEAVRRADAVLLHVVDNTKTGYIGPDIDAVVALAAEHRGKLFVVVDACQFRLERANLHRYLSYGFAVLITGSKFYTGPPFGGAMLVPESWHLRDDTRPFPEGFRDYFTRREMPRALQSRARHFSPELNLGLLFRWRGALTEMSLFYSVPPHQRTRILETFCHAVIESIQENSDLLLVPGEPPRRWLGADTTYWDAQPTIFSFAVRGPIEWLRVPELRSVYYALNRDCAAALPADVTNEERALAAQRCHIGQPVTIARDHAGRETGALRIACGARLVYGIFYDESLGATPAARFARELHDAQTVFAKVSLIVKYWEHFDA